LPASPSEAAWRSALLIPALPRTTSLEIYDLRAVSPDVLLSISTLAGLVNRGAAKLYGIMSDDDEFWLNEIDPSLAQTRVLVTGDDILEHLLNAYRGNFKGLILYDPDLPATLNVATTLAGLRDGIVVSPTRASRLQEAPHGLPVLADLRTHGWKTSLQAYAWAYKYLLPHCSPDLVAGLDPRIRGYLRSFLVAHRVFTCWLDPRKIVPSPSAGWLCERGLLKRVLASFAPGTVHLGWFVSEPFGIRLTSQAALLTLASDYCTNLEVWSSLPESPPSQKGVPVSLEGRENDLDKEEKAKRIYLSFTMSDGDNLQYCQHRLLQLWRDPARGSLPLGWTISPALRWVMPALAGFYQRTATKNDELIAGPSGAAYILPAYFPRTWRAAFLTLTAESMQAMQLTSLQILDGESFLSWFSMKFLNARLQKLFASRLVPHGLRGIFSGGGGIRPSWSQRSGVLIYQNLGLAAHAGRTLRLIKWAARRTRFLNVYIFAWNMTPSDLQDVVKQLGDNVCVVTPARLLELIQREAN